MNNRRCDACGCAPKGGIGMGGAYLCRGCAAEIEVEVKRLHTEGKRVSVPGIARRRYKENVGVTIFPAIRDFPEPLAKRLKIAAAQEDTSIRSLVIRSVEWYLDQMGS